MSKYSILFSDSPFTMFEFQHNKKQKLSKGNQLIISNLIKK
jgi:hypothetical protein